MIDDEIRKRLTPDECEAIEAASDDWLESRVSSLLARRLSEARRDVAKLDSTILRLKGQLEELKESFTACRAEATQWQQRAEQAADRLATALADPPRPTSKVRSFDEGGG